MPARRPYRKKKRTYKKRTYNRPRTRAALIPRPRTYAFSRATENFLNMDAPTNGWVTTADNAVVRTFAWDLNSLTANSEFTNLFAQYKLNYAVVKMFPTVSKFVAVQGAPIPSAYGGNSIITVWRNVHGVALDSAFSTSDLLQIQSKRQFMVPSSKPTIIKMPLKQSSNLYGSLTNTDYAAVKPKYVSTTETSTPHYGLNVHIRKIDGTPYGAGGNDMLVKEQILLTCRQVK